MAGFLALAPLAAPLAAGAARMAAPLLGRAVAGGLGRTVGGAAGRGAGGLAGTAGRLATSTVKSPLAAAKVGQMIGGMGGDSNEQSEPRETRNDSFSRGLTTSDPASEASRLAYVHNLNS